MLVSLLALTLGLTQLLPQTICFVFMVINAKEAIWQSVTGQVAHVTPNGTLAPWQRNTLVGHLEDRVTLPQASQVRRTTGQQLIHQTPSEDEPKGRLLCNLHIL